MFYSKPVTNPLTILQRSAMPEGTKVATFSNEVTRRLKTSSTSLSRTTMENILGELLDNLGGMGYGEQWRTKVLRGAMTGYTRILHKVTKGETSRNRKGAETLTNRRFKALVGAKDWYRLGKEDDAWELMPPWERAGGPIKRQPSHREHDARYVETIIFVPHTPEGALKAKLSKAEANLKYPSRTKFVEEMGRSLREMMCRAEPDPQHCGR